MATSRRGCKCGPKGPWKHKTPEQKAAALEARKAAARQRYWDNREKLLAAANAYARAHRTGYKLWQERRPHVLALAERIERAFLSLPEDRRQAYAIKLLRSENAIVKGACGVPRVDFGWLGAYAGL